MKKIILFLLISISTFGQNPVTPPARTTSVLSNQNYNNRNLYNATTINFASESLTTAQMNAITTPKLAREIYNVDTNTKWYYNGTIWVNMGNFWGLNGNSNTTASNFIGTTDANNLRFATNNTQKATILTNGNVGIGITNPTEKLEVGGNIITQTAVNQNAGVSIFAGTGTTASELNLGRNGARIWHFGLQGTNRFSFIESGVAERLSILQGGNVGIGTTNPTSKFQVNGSQAGAVTTVTANITLNATHHKILVNNAATNITINLPDAASCLGRKYEISRYAGSTGTITIQSIGNQMQSLTGTIGALSSISAHSATGGGLRHSFTAVSVGVASVWVRL